MDAQSNHSVDSVVREIRKIPEDSLRLDSLFAYNKHLWETMPSQTIAVITVALEEARKANSRFFIGKSYSAFGYSYLLISDYPRSLKYFLDALPIWKELGDHTREVETLTFLANIHCRNGDLNTARQFAEQAIAIAGKRQVGKLEAKALNELAVVYQRQDQPLRAIAIYEKGILAARREQDKFYEAFLLGNMAFAFRSLDQLPRALKIYFEVTHIGDSLNEPYIVMVGQFNIADIYFQVKKLKESETYALRSLAIAKQINESETLTGSYSLLRQVAEKRGDYKSALDYFTREIEIRDTVFNQKKSAQLTEMQTRFDTKLKDRQIREQHIQIAYSKRINLFLWLGIILITGVGIIIWLQQRRAARLHRLVAEHKKELEQVNGVKDRIFSVISHDMRTPVNSLLAFMELMEQDDMTQEKLTAYGAELKTSMQDTAALLENLLNWAKSQMQGYKPVTESFELCGRVKETIRLFLPEADKKKIAVTMSELEGIFVSADIHMTSIVLRNLLHNAIKYTDPGGAIVISAVHYSGSVRLRIEDNGVGFTQEMVDSFNKGAMFNPFSSTPGTAQEQGTGLRLLLCRTFLQLMKGTVHLESECGKGSLFIITLPSGS